MLRRVRKMQNSDSTLPISIKTGSDENNSVTDFNIMNCIWRISGAEYILRRPAEIKIDRPKTSIYINCFFRHQRLEQRKVSPRSHLIPALFSFLRTFSFLFVRKCSTILI